MAHSVLRSLAYLAGILAGCGTAYYWLCIGGARKFLSQSRDGKSENQQAFPPVSILKPLRGTDPQMYESFRSHCQQDYPEYEIIFGVSDADDPAILEVQRLMQEFPERNIRLVLCPAKLGPNLKVSNLVQMVELASHQHLLINDSDIRVPRDYLRRVCGHFSDPRVGMVTTLYRGIPEKTLASRLEAVGINTDFAAGVLSANLLENGLHFGLGSTLAFSRAVLDRIGGFAPLLDYLADDYELGRRIADAGHKVVLSGAVVETFLPNYSFRAFLDHQLRWGRTIRDSRPLGYLGMVLTFGLPWALVALVLSHAARWSIMLFAAALVSRIAMALLVAGSVLHEHRAGRNLLLVVLRDCIALCVWFATYLSHRIVWRGDTFALKHGKLVRI